MCLSQQNAEAGSDMVGVWIALLLPNPFKEVDIMVNRIGLDGRHRVASGQIDRKHGSTTVKRLRGIYTDGFAKGRRSDLMLVNLLADEKVESLRQLLKKHPRWH